MTLSLFVVLCDELARACVVDDFAAIAQRIQKSVHFLKTFFVLFILTNDLVSIGRFILPVGSQNASSLVVARNSVNLGFNENQSVFGVGILSILFQMFADGDSLLDQVIKIFRDFGGKTVLLQNTKNLLASDGLDLANAVGISQNNTDLRRSKTLSGKFANLVFHFVSRGFNPLWSRATIRDDALAQTLSKKLY